MRRKNITSRFVVVIVVIVAICVLSALYSGVTGNQSPVTRLVGMVTTPIQKLGTGISGLFGKGHEYFFEVDDLKAENEALKKQVREMEQKVRDAQIALDENDRLRRRAQPRPDAADR